MRLFAENPLARAAILEAAYETVLAAHPGLAPEVKLASSAADASVTIAAAASPAAWMRDVIAACDPAPVDGVMVGLDLAARMLLAGEAR
ncbi:hypothetical protein ACFLIM_42455 [Nonomuraea sp. M3C6]|uniref:Uncharacterized protein n=1 Tax=Nonomuraea marmarensis TaxID=3351344 RepID=A0ABW7AR07_9ACTN